MKILEKAFWRALLATGGCQSVWFLRKICKYVFERHKKFDWCDQSFCAMKSTTGSKTDYLWNKKMYLIL